MSSLFDVINGKCSTKCGALENYNLSLKWDDLSKSMTVKFAPGTNEDFEENDWNHAKVLGRQAKLIISGILFQVRWETLRKFPNTRLGQLAMIINDDTKSESLVCFRLQIYNF